MTKLINKLNTNRVKKYECNLNWDAVKNKLKFFCRNSQLLAIAPNTSTSLLLGASSSFLPIFARFFSDKANKGDSPVLPMYLKDKYWFYQVNNDIDQKYITELVGQSIQPWIDSGISMELIVNLNILDAKSFYDLLMAAWKNKCKTVYYLRIVPKDETIELKKKECSVCAN